jgi:septal ring-binding cell division protein DamX
VPIDTNRIHFVEQGISSLTQLWQQLPKSLLSGLVGIFVVVLLLLTWFDFSSSAPEVVAASPDGVSELAYSASIEAVTPVLKEPDVNVSQVCDKSIDQPAQTTEKNSQVTSVQDRSEVVLQATALAANKEMAKPVITHKSLAYWQEKRKETLDALVPLALQNKYSIQLLSSSWHLRDKFSITVRDIQQRLPEQRGYYIDYVLADGRLRIAWIYGIYDSAEDAKIALSSFPDSVVMFQPVVVSLKQVVGQMKHQLPHYQSSSKCGNL